MQTYATDDRVTANAAMALQCVFCGHWHYPKQAWLHAACEPGSPGRPTLRDGDGVKRAGLVMYPVHRVTDGVLDAGLSNKQVANTLTKSNIAPKESNKSAQESNNTASQSNKFDKATYQREYMAKRRAKK